MYIVVEMDSKADVQKRTNRVPIVVVGAWSKDDSDTSNVLIQEYRREDVPQ